MKPIILITVYRRYHELLKNLEKVHELGEELRLTPHIVLVWNTPESGRLWLIQDLIKQRKVTHVITREGEGGNITYEESRNIRAGLEFIDKNYHNYYVIMQAADINPVKGIYRHIENQLYQGKKAVLFFWEHGCFNSDVYHTNFWGVKDKSYWPPLANRDSPDVLERLWGMDLAQRGLTDFILINNHGGRNFKEKHESENLPSIESRLDIGGGVFCYIRGSVSTWERFKKWLKWW